MKNQLTSLLLLAVAIPTAAHAQLVLHAFSGFASPQTVFFGDWSATGDPFAGSSTPSPLLAQGAGFFAFEGVSNADVSFVEYTFINPHDLSALGHVSLSLRLLDGNTAQSLTVFLLDTATRTASATFMTSVFNADSFIESSLSLTADNGFDARNVTAFRLSGNDPFGGALMSLAIDNLSARAAVPEPSTYGLAGASALLLLVALLRRRPGGN